MSRGSIEAGVADVALARWREAFQRETAGKSPEALTRASVGGVPVAPLYDRIIGPPVDRDLRRQGGWSFELRHAFGRADDLPQICADVTEAARLGADRQWIVTQARLIVPNMHAALLEAAGTSKIVFVVDDLGEAGATDPRREDPPSTADHCAGSERWLDPFGTWLQEGRRARTFEASIAAAARALGGEAGVGGGGPTRVLVSARALAAAGADLVERGAGLLALAVDTVRALEAEGVPTAVAFSSVVLDTVQGRDLWTEVASLRAVRACWSRVQEVSGVAGRPRAWISACGSDWERSSREAWVDVLRATNACVAAILGGADGITMLLPTDEDARTYFDGVRLAINGQWILSEEAGLGRVDDPAGGSYAIEALTESLAERLWARLGAIEAAGGARFILRSGNWQRALAAQRRECTDAVVRGRYPLLGVLPHAAPPGRSGIVGSTTGASRTGSRRAGEVRTVVETHGADGAGECIAPLDAGRADGPIARLAAALEEARRRRGNGQRAWLVRAGDDLVARRRLDEARGWTAAVGVDSRIEPLPAHPDPVAIAELEARLQAQSEPGKDTDEVLLVCAADEHHASWAAALAASQSLRPIPRLAVGGEADVVAAHGSAWVPAGGDMVDALARLWSGVIDVSSGGAR